MQTKHYLWIKKFFCSSTWLALINLKLTKTFHNNKKINWENINNRNYTFVCLLNVQWKLWKYSKNMTVHREIHWPLHQLKVKKKPWNFVNSNRFQYFIKIFRKKTEIKEIKFEEKKLSLKTMWFVQFWETNWCQWSLR